MTWRDRKGYGKFPSMWPMMAQGTIYTESCRALAASDAITVFKLRHMKTSTIERGSAAPNTFDRTKELEPGQNRGKVAGATQRREVCRANGSARRWQTLFASFLRRS
jgi:hypothetical protein